MASAQTVLDLVPLALIVALVCMMQTAAVLRAFPSQPGLRLVVIEASGITELDNSGASVLMDVVASLHAQHIEVALARLSGERAQAQAERTGVLGAFGSDRVFRSVEDAVRALTPASR
jgi:MFS superfamily sulfate permease-like transporter